MDRAIVIVVLAFGTFLTVPATAVDDGGSHKFYSVNGARLYVESFGQGRPILFLHGGLMFFDSAYAKQRDYFQAGHQVVGIDQRGHGHSPDGPWQLSYQLMADDTAAVIQSLKIGPVDVVGHSDGGNIALLLARDHPELVHRLIISGANLRGLPPQKLEARRQLSAAQLEERVEKLAAILPPSFRTDYGAVSPDGVDHWMAMVTKCYWLWAQSIVIDPDDLKKIQSPVLVVAGDHDLTPIEETTEIFRGLPHGQLLLVPGTGHGTYQDRPKLMNLAIQEFLDQPEGKATVPCTRFADARRRALAAPPDDQERPLSAAKLTFLRKSRLWSMTSDQLMVLPNSRA
jgi:pimeloyl-ACP methyl ester carboxylesterase